MNFPKSNYACCAFVTYLSSAPSGSLRQVLERVNYEYFEDYINKMESISIADVCAVVADKKFHNLLPLVTRLCKEPKILIDQALSGIQEEHISLVKPPFEVGVLKGFVYAVDEIPEKVDKETFIYVAKNHRFGWFVDECLKRCDERFEIGDLLNLGSNDCHHNWIVRVVERTNNFSIFHLNKLFGRNYAVYRQILKFCVESKTEVFEFLVCGGGYGYANDFFKENKSKIVVSPDAFCKIAAADDICLAYEVLENTPVLNLKCLKKLGAKNLRRMLSPDFKKVKISQVVFDKMALDKSPYLDYCEPIKVVKNIECMICLLEFEPGDTLSTSINCGHLVHKNCYDNRLKRFGCFCGENFSTR